MAGEGLGGRFGQLGQPLAVGLKELDQAVRRFAVTSISTFISGL